MTEDSRSRKELELEQRPGADGSTRRTDLSLVVAMEMRAVRQSILLVCALLLAGLGCAHTNRLSLTEEPPTAVLDSHARLSRGILAEARERLKEGDYGSSEDLFSLVALYGATTNLQAAAAATLERDYENFMRHTRHRHGPAVALAEYHFLRKNYARSLRFSTEVLDDDILAIVARHVFSMHIAALLRLGELDQAQQAYDEWKDILGPARSEGGHFPDWQKVIDKRRGHQHLPEPQR